MMTKDESLEKILETESNKCAKGILPEDGSVDDQIYVGLVKEWDAKKLEALCLSGGDIHPLSKIEAMLFRGRIEEARQALEQYTQSVEGNEDAIAGYEIALKKARLAALEGDWSAAKTVCDEALTAPITPQSTMALLQIRSVAQFELGRLSSALDDINRLDSFSTLLPHSLTNFYWKISRIRILARDRDLQKGLDDLKRMLDKKVSDQVLTLDELLTILRAQIDLLRLAGKNHVEQALAAFLTARAMGDELYAGLSLQDLFYALPEKERYVVNRDLMRYQEQFVRVRRIADELSSESESLSQTAQSILVYNELKAADEESPISAEDLEIMIRSVKKVAFLGAQFVLDLEPIEFRYCQSRPQLFQALEILSSGQGVSKPDFFMKMWKTDQFDSKEHDSLVRTVLHRIRKFLGVGIRMTRKQIELEPIAIVGNRSI